MKKNSSSNDKLAVIILAAGKGTRMGGNIPKVLHESANGKLLFSVLDAALELKPKKIIAVTGFERELVEDAIDVWEKTASTDSVQISTCIQKEQKGTGDAVKAALPELEGFMGEILILCGDVPLLKAETLLTFISSHHSESATLSVLTAQVPDPKSYGRMVRDSSGLLTAIREAKDSSPKELLIHEINAGVYCVDSAFLEGALMQLSTNNAQGEYYLTDIVERAFNEGQKIQGALLASSDEIIGVNTPEDLAAVNRVYQKREFAKHLMGGVQILSPESTFIHPSAKIGKGTTVGPSTYIGKGVIIGENVTIEGLCRIINSTVKDNVHLKWGLRIEESSIGESSMVGPFAHIRPGTTLGKDVKIGNFVETKKATLDDGAKASHLTYLGDCTVGKDANIGAGTITCNYDGYNKFQTEIGDGAFIGSNSSLVAPVKIGEGATIGAGSTITKDVEKDSLAVTRANQKSVPGWSKKKRENS